ncbi:hypothetical protein Vretifemale_17539 [Volvox reticuliferus]|uniref:Uncharacterized protein n=1 Tax=Volvox reticuliferus TaxID=1737510 RepID=A0A8J4CXX7_9CHLO|nr:hypothetical protein Vretifemale_17539 [Volvox reticuliferus]
MSVILGLADFSRASTYHPSIIGHSTYQRCCISSPAAIYNQLRARPTHSVGPAWTTAAQYGCPKVHKAPVTIFAAARNERPSTTKAQPHISTAIFTGTYATIGGIALVLAPKQTFGLLFGAEPVPLGWIRVGGILFTLIGWYYLGTALADCKGQGALGFYRTTVWSRVALAVGFALLVATGQVPATLLVLAALNLFGALSMHIALGRGGFNKNESDGSEPVMKM